MGESIATGRVEDYVLRYHSTDFTGALPPRDQFLQIRQRYLEWLEDNYRAVLPASKETRVLDVGCGTGEVLVFLKRFGYTQVEGIEIASRLVEYCREIDGCRVSQVSDARTFLESHPNAFDVIHLGDVIEHFPKSNLFATLDAIHAALCPGGFLLIHTPNAVGMAGLYQRYTSLSHELCFNERSLKKMLEAAGFQQVKIFGERIAFRWRPKLLAWLALRAIWLSCLGAIYTIELGSERPRVLTRTLLAQAFKT